MKKTLQKKYPKIYRFIYEQEFLTHRFLVISVLIIAAFYYFQKKKEHAFSKTDITIGIVDEICSSTKNRSVYFHYTNKKGETIDIEDQDVDPGCIEYRKPGDTIIIEYSLIDGDYAEVLECYWNETLIRKYGFDQTL